jgi:hypothetical protein
MRQRTAPVGTLSASHGGADSQGVFTIQNDEIVASGLARADLEVDAIALPTLLTQLALFAANADIHGRSRTRDFRERSRQQHRHLERFDAVASDRPGDRTQHAGALLGLPQIVLTFLSFQ